jgi:cytochrome b
VPTRLFHWTLVLLFGFSWWTAETDRLDWHMLSGYAILVLVLFRIYWGLVGSESARFGAFVKGPRAFLAYAARLADRTETPSLGHNPMGGWSVVAFLALLLLQAGLGLFAIDVDGLNAGPLNDLVSFDAGRRIAGLHYRVFNLLLVLTALHVAAIAFYAVYRRENLIAAMTTGVKRVWADTRPQDPQFTKLIWALLGFLIATAAVTAIVLGRS